MDGMEQPYELFSGMFKSWMEAQENAFQTFAAAASGPGAAVGTVAAGPPAPPSNLPLFTINEMWKASLERWVALMQQPSHDSLPEETLRKLFDPNQWAKAGQDPFHAAIEHLATGPTYADLWIFDKKLLRAQHLKLQQERDVGAYHAVVRAAWKNAFDRFSREVNDADAKPLTSWRALTDLWIKIANDALNETHRTPEFLEAQRAMTRSATEYRLQQREIVEGYCETHHIPTRTEVDEVQRTVYELRRQLRALEASLSAASRKDGGKNSQSPDVDDSGEAPAEPKAGRGSPRSSPSTKKSEAQDTTKTARKRANAPARKKPGVSP